MKQKIAVFIISLLWAPLVLAQESLSSVDQEALSKTQALLQNPDQRKEMIRKDNKARKTDQMVDKLVKTPEQKEALFKIASDIFGDITHKNGGNAKAMTETLKKATESPEEFFRGLSSEQKNAIKNLSNSIEGPTDASPH